MGLPEQAKRRWSAALGLFLQRSSPPPPPPPLEVPEALALMKQFFGKDWRSRVKAPQTGDWVWVDPAAPSHEQELNASDERGISAVREKAERMEFCMAGCRMV